MKKVLFVCSQNKLRSPTAEQVFSTRGIQATTMDEIAELVGVTKPLIYDYFGSKDGLLAATIERARGQLLAALTLRTICR